MARTPLTAFFNRPIGELNLGNPILPKGGFTMAKSKQRRSRTTGHLITLTVDIGGSGVKALLLDPQGHAKTERLRVLTPQPSTPKAVIDSILELSKALPGFHRVSVGFPGVVQDGRIKTAPNLDPSWPGTNLTKELERQLGKPVRAANDADVQGYGAIEGHGVEMVITLGTGFGTALFVNGHLVPNLEIAHHPFRKRQTYEVQLGDNALKLVGKKRWNQRLAKAIAILDGVMNYDHLFIGGGNAKKVTIPLPDNVSLVSNMAGLLGGIALWTNGNVRPSSKSFKQSDRSRPASRSMKKSKASKVRRTLHAPSRLHH